MIFFTADTHLSHSNIVRYCDRPFSNIREHDDAIIANWNSVVSKKDVVYHLGDFGFGSPYKLYDISLKLNGTIHLIKGNHDKSTVRSPCKDRFETIRDVHMLTAQENGKTYQFFLSHYAHRTWNKSHWDVPHLYGHSHGNLPYYRNSLDVGVDCHNFYPISIEQVLYRIAEMNSKEAVKQIFDTMFGEK